MVFGLVLIVHALPLPWTTRKFNLLIASYVFYSAWNPPFVILLWIATVVDWYAAQGLVRAQRQNSRRAWMLLSVVANLGMLGYFKYGTFLLENFRLALLAWGIDYQPPAMDIVLPVGISFYTFATMSYTLDIYLRRAARHATSSTTHCSSRSSRILSPDRSCVRPNSCRNSSSHGARTRTSSASALR